LSPSLKGSVSLSEQRQRRCLLKLKNRGRATRVLDLVRGTLSGLAWQENDTSWPDKRKPRRFVFYNAGADVFFDKFADTHWSPHWSFHACGPLGARKAKGWLALISSSFKSCASFSIAQSPSFDVQAPAKRSSSIRSVSISTPDARAARTAS